MGRGFAEAVAEMVGEDALAAARGAGWRVGEAHVLVVNDRRIFNVVTKERYYMKPSMQDFEKAFAACAAAAGGYTVAMPRVGAGLDGLEWDKVAETLHSVAVKAGARFVVYDGAKGRRGAELRVLTRGVSEIGWDDLSYARWRRLCYLTMTSPWWVAGDEIDIELADRTGPGQICAEAHTLVRKLAERFAHEGTPLRARLHRHVVAGEHEFGAQGDVVLMFGDPNDGTDVAFNGVVHAARGPFLLSSDTAVAVPECHGERPALVLDTGSMTRTGRRAAVTKKDDARDGWDKAVRGGNVDAIMRSWRAIKRYVRGEQQQGGAGGGGFNINPVPATTLNPAWVREKFDAGYRNLDVLTPEHWAAFSTSCPHGPTTAAKLRVIERRETARLTDSGTP